MQLDRHQIYQIFFEDLGVILHILLILFLTKIRHTILNQPIGQVLNFILAC